MRNKKNYILPIVCVSLKSSVARRTILDENLAGFSNNFPNEGNMPVYFDAINGKELSPSIASLLKTWVSGSKQNERPLTLTEIGCMLSHLIVWSKFLTGEYGDTDHLIILEDDVSPTEIFVEGMLQIAKSPPDFAFLSAFPGGNNKKITATQGDGVAISMFGPRYHYTRTCAYILSKHVARRFLSRQINSPYVADNWEYLLEANYQILYPIFKHPEAEKIQSSIELERSCINQPKAHRWIRLKRKFIVFKLKTYILFHKEKYKKLSDILL